MSVENGDVDPDEVGAGAESRLALLRWGVLCWRRRRVLSRANGRAQRQHSTHRHGRRDRQTRDARGGTHAIQWSTTADRDIAITVETLCSVALRAALSVHDVGLELGIVTKIDEIVGDGCRW